MKRTLLIGSLAACISLSGLFAEEKPAPALDLAARKESVANLEIHIAQREQRLAEWGRDIKQLDVRIEKQVEELVKMLTGLRDSQNSRTKVTQLKKSAIEGLKYGIDRYARKRREIRELVRTGSDEALEDLGKLDQRILKRVDQIAELTKSIPTHDDVDKYEADGASYWDGYYNESSRVSDEYKQNRRDTVQSNKQREDTTKVMKAALDRLDQRRRSLKDLLANRKITDSERALYNTELGQIGAYEEHLNEQLRDVTLSSGSGGGQAVGREQAHDIEALFEDARRDLREDVSRLFLTYDQYVRGRAYLADLKQNLAARKEWLKKNASEKSGTP